MSLDWGDGVVFKHRNSREHRGSASFSHAKRERLYDSRMPAATLRILARNIESDAFSRKNLDFISYQRRDYELN